MNNYRNLLLTDIIEEKDLIQTKNGSLFKFIKYKEIDQAIVKDMNINLTYAVYLPITLALKYNK